MKWTEEAVRAEANKYNTKKEFQRSCGGAYNAARKLKIIDSLFENQKRAWSDDMLRAEASKYKTKAAFVYGNKTAYNLALRRGIIDALGFVNQLRTAHYWNEERARAEASKYKTKTEFARGCKTGYVFALNMNLLDDLGFQDQPGCDNDAIYIWRAVGQHYNGSPVYKIGVTSARLGTRRVEDVAKGVGFEYDLICCERVQCKATDLERKLHVLGENPGYSGFDGATEFRALSDSALYAAVSMICNQVTE